MSTVQHRLLSTSPVQPRDATAPELVFGLIGAVGTDLGYLTDRLAEALRVVSYDVEVIRLSALLTALPLWEGEPPAPDGPRDEYINAYQDKGDEVRRRTFLGGALAQLAIRSIRERRFAAASAQSTDVDALGAEILLPPMSGTAFILRSLKHPDEAAALRNVYRDRFVLVAAHLPKDEAIGQLTIEVANSRNEEQSRRHNTLATEIYDREAEPDRDVSDQEIEKRKVTGDLANAYGQNVRDTYQVADYFVDASTRDTIADDASRLIRLIFRAPFDTPSREEVAMSMASAAAVSSSAMGRQVGAVIIGRQRGEVLGVGINEVPRAGGGPYWSGDLPDGRDFAFDQHTDSVVVARRNMVNEVITLLVREGVIPAREGGAIPVDELLRALRTARLSKLVEFGRPVHAELMAITDAARRGVALEGGVLVCTTYPCHACARHIVAAGIDEVIYIEPYAKSLTDNLHSDSVVRDRRLQGDKRVLFRQFLGVAPRLYDAAFRRSGDERRDPHGIAIQYSPKTAKPHVTDDALVYQYSEWAAIQTVQDALEKAGLVTPAGPQETAEHDGSPG